MNDEKHSDFERFISLHKYWCTADAVKQVMLVDVGGTNVQGEPVDMAELWSKSLRMTVFYALTYVVIEGYNEISCAVVDIDKLLAREEYVDQLRRLRNALIG